MYKIMIVDDEKVERDGLTAILKKGFPDVVIEQARNGIAAIEKSSTFQPDIVLMDIKMAGMTGLEAVEHISGVQPDILFVMVTAFESFEFARQAIRFGVKDYLLKPSKASEIIATIGRLMGEVNERRKQRETAMQEKEVLQAAVPLMESGLVTQLLFDEVQDVHAEALMQHLQVAARAEMFVMTMVFAEMDQQRFHSMKEKIRALGHAIAGAMNGKQLPIIVFCQGERSFHSQAMSLAQELLQSINHDKGSGCFIGIGNPYATFGLLKQSYQESQIATMDSNRPVKYRFYSDMPEFHNPQGGAWNKQTEKRFFEQIRQGQWEGVREVISGHLQQLEREGTSMLLVQQKALEMLWLVMRVLDEMGIETASPFFTKQAEQGHTLVEETLRLLERMQRSYLTFQTEVKSDVISQMKQYIMMHAHQDISLESIAEHVKMSPMYLSKLFKEQIGLNYIDFLTDCRIEKAKKLMLDPEKSLKEIAIESGYSDPNYFSKVFKKCCDAAPSDYRKTLLIKKGLES